MYIRDCSTRETSLYELVDVRGKVVASSPSLEAVHAARRLLESEPIPDAHRSAWTKTFLYNDY